MERMRMKSNTRMMDDEPPDEDCNYSRKPQWRTSHSTASSDIPPTPDEIQSPYYFKWFLTSLSTLSMRQTCTVFRTILPNPSTLELKNLNSSSTLNPKLCEESAMCLSNLLHRVRVSGQVQFSVSHSIKSSSA